MKRYQGVRRVCAWLMCLIGLTGCVSNAAVKCDGRLYPINAPALLVRNHDESNVAPSGMATQEVER